MFEATPAMPAPAAATRLRAEGHLRLLILSLLLWGTTLVMQGERAPVVVEGFSSVFEQPPAYLHPPAALAFDVSGVPVAAAGTIEAALFESVRSADDHGTRAHTHMSLAVYYKLSGQSTLAARAKRKGDYWWRVARF